MLDVGCGPGQVAALLADCGSTVIGVDLAPAMLAVARRRTPSLPLTSADMRALPVRDGCCGGVVAYYSVQHVARAGLGGVLDEFRRVVIPGGLLVIATHLGEGGVVVEEFLGHTIEPVGGTFYERTELARAIESAGFAIEDVRERDALEHEHPSRRVYLTAQAITSPPGRRPVL